VRTTTLPPFVNLTSPPNIATQKSASERESAQSIDMTPVRTTAIREL
jgi:hypothetical protein